MSYSIYHDVLTYAVQSSTAWRATTIIVCAFFTVWLSATLLSDLGHSYVRQNAGPIWTDAIAERMVKPHNTTIVAVIFYGRERFFRILDCYLRQNLVSNGGWLDEVRIILNTKDKDDLGYVNDLVKNDDIPEYNLVPYTEKNFANMYRQYFSDPDTIYVKVDDDLIYIHDEAIPRLVTTLIAHPEALHVQANTINNKATHYFHYRTGALLPFLPDPAQSSNETTPQKGASQRRPVDRANLTTWRTSNLPPYTTSPAIADPPFDVAKVPWYQGDHLQRWLPLPNTWANLQKTPAVFSPPPEQPTSYGMLPPVDWGLAAQEHYSFLSHLEHRTLSSYYFGDDRGLWNPGHAHYNIHLMAIRGSTLRRYPFWEWHYEAIASYESKSGKKGGTNRRKATANDSSTRHSSTRVEHGLRAAAKDDDEIDLQADAHSSLPPLNSAGNILYGALLGSDEFALTEYIPKNFERYYLVDSHALAAHYAFHAYPGGQEQMLRSTDLLERYTLYANEYVCAKKIPL